MLPKRVVGITSCAAGIAHTYMAAESLSKTADELGIGIKVETQGTIGTENELTLEEIKDADVVIIASDVSVDLNRFVGKKIYEVDTNDAIKDSKGIFQNALEKSREYGSKGSVVNGIQLGTSSNKFLKYLMSGLQDMIPLTIAAGLLLAFANMNAFHADPNNADLVVWGFSKTTSGVFWSKLFEVGQIGFTLMIPVFAAGVARAIGDKPAVAPAFIAAYMINDANFLGTKTGAGFLGAILVGFGVGYLVLALKRIPWPNAIKSIVPIMIIPVISTFLSFVVIYYLVGQPIAAGMNVLYKSINSLTTSYAAAPVIYGAILGAMMGFDMGGPVNKTALLVGNAIFVDSMNQFGVQGVNAIPQAATTAAICIAPMGAAFATFFFKKSFSTEERALGSSAFVMSLVGVTEGAIPFAAAHPQLIIANTISSSIAGGLAGLFGLQYYGGIGSPVGAFVGYVTGPKFAQLWWIIAILIAVVVNMFLYRLLLGKKYDTVSSSEVLDEE